MKPKVYQKFFAELKRRRVFNTTALYGGVAFVVFQAADFVVPALHLSDSVSTAIVLIAACGLPIVIALAWMFDLTPDGVSLSEPPGEGELEAIVGQPISRRWPVGIAALAGIALLVGGVGWEFKDLVGSEEEVPRGEVDVIGSVAVLPFLNLTGDESATFLSEGIAEELSEALRRVPGLKVAGQLSASSFRASEIDFALVGEELGVLSFLDGSVGNAGDQIEIAVRLVSAQNGDQLWTHRYHLPKDQFLVALDGVARDVTDHLGVPQFSDVAHSLVLPSTTNFTSYRDYLRGRYLAQQRTSEALESAIRAYHKALLLDPDFSLAWSALATAYVLLPDFGGPPAPEILPYAQAALDRAIAPGIEMPEGFAASGFLKWLYLWDFQGAEEDLRRSIDMDPFNPISRYWYARVLTTQRRWDEAREQAQAALEIDPRSPAAQMTLGLLLFSEGREGAQEAFRSGLEGAPELQASAFLLGALLAWEGELEGAALEFERFSTLTGNDPGPFHAYLSALSDPAKKAEAVSALQGPTFFGPTQGAALLAHLGETEAALSLLEKAAEEHSPYLVWANALPQFEAIRSNQQFQAVLAWVGF